jgi:hypothetical protein
MSSTAYIDEKALAEIELVVEEIEEVIAPKIATNHNETLAEEVELEVEVLEETIAPTPSIPIPPPAPNHNETLVNA